VKLDCQFHQNQLESKMIENKMNNWDTINDMSVINYENEQIIGEKVHKAM
jgi:hypothetical protein